MIGRLASFIGIFLCCQMAMALMPPPCNGQRTVTIAAVGDVLLHEPLQTLATEQGFLRLWQNVIPYIQSADIAFANIEGPIAENAKLSNGKVYSSYPLFNYPPQLAYALRDTGFDVVNLANNHSLDRFSGGVDKTIMLLNQLGIQHTGTTLAKKPPQWVTFTNVNGFRIAWIGCTVHTNGIQDKYHQVLLCYGKKDRKTIMGLIKKLKNKVDAIIVTPHWGKQYDHKPNASQKHFAKQMLNAGATVILGTHPHVLQPMKMFMTKDGRKTFIAYSLGNFVSNQGTPNNRASVVLLLQLAEVQGRLQVCSMRYLPTYMQNRHGQNNISLTILGPGDKQSVGYRIISRILPVKANLANMGQV